MKRNTIILLLLPIIAWILMGAVVVKIPFDGSVSFRAKAVQEVPPNMWDNTVIFLDDVLSNYTSTSNGNTDVWMDPIRGISATQSTHLNKPLIEGKSLTFQYGNSLSSNLQLPISSLTVPLTLNFAAGDLHNNMNANFMFGGEPATWTTTWFPGVMFSSGSGNKIGISDYNVLLTNAPNVDFETYSFHTYSFRFNSASNIDMWKDGIEVVHGHATTTIGLWGNKFTLGNTPGRAFPWANFYAYSHNSVALTDNQIKALHTYWRNKYP